MRAALVLPVRLAVGSRVVQTTTRSVSPQAVLVRCVAPPAPGSPVSLRLYLPDGPPEDLHGVASPAPPGEGPGCTVELRGLTEAQRARLVAVIAPPVLQRGTPPTGAGPVVPGRPLGSRPVLVPPPPPDPAPPPPGPPAPPPGPPAPPPEPPAPPRRGPELRALVRVPVELKVSFESSEAAADQLALNLSAGGMFVRCEPQPPLGAEVSLTFELPDEPWPLVCQALVVHRTVREEARQSGRPAGVGLQFLDADDRFRAELDAYLARAQGLTPLDE